MYIPEVFVSIISLAKLVMNVSISFRQSKISVYFNSLCSFVFLGRVMWRYLALFAKGNSMLH